MAGHSKWKNIQHRKNAQDAKRGKVFMQHAKNVYDAAKKGGNPDMNPSLRTVIDKAKQDNMPNENIDRAIQKATGTLNGAQYEEITYEGYGPGGVAIIVQTLTDNRNRTAAEIRHAFSKNGGNLGETGSVSFVFNRRGYILILDQSKEIDEDELTLVALEAGAEDLVNQDGAFEIITEPQDFEAVEKEISAAGYEIEQAEITLIPNVEATVNDEQKETMHQLLDMLEEDEDTQDVHHNMAEIE